MNKRICIIANTEGLPGVKTDIRNYQQFFKSSYGGDWNDGEIITLVNESRATVLSRIQSMRNMVLDYAIVIFSGHGGQLRETMLELNAAGELVGESELQDISPRQLNIYDCCRAYPETFVKGILNEMETRLFAKINTRARYETRIMEAAKQQARLYACALGEVSYDTEAGGIYSKNLLDCALRLDSEFKLVASAHEQAAVLTTAAIPEQHPAHVLPRGLASQQLIIAIRP